ncbi:hypothetical protein ACE1OC_01295 [Streptomyces sp. DSM 116496]|uniref:hypothetical protein n=1 Tax=Streptomyces stoeckheimensis TaxID=3344656 RepID=UPI0038B3DF39
MSDVLFAPVAVFSERVLRSVALELLGALAAGRRAGLRAQGLLVGPLGARLFLAPFAGF